MVHNSNNETDFPLKLLLTNTQVANLRKAFANKSSTDNKLSKTLGRLHGPLLNTGLPLLKYVSKLLAKSVLVPLVLSATALAADAGIHKKFLGFGQS